MISAQQGLDLQRLDTLRADPALPDVRRALVALQSLAVGAAQTPVHQSYYAINKLLNLIDGGP